MEVDTWTRFSRHFVHAADAEALRPAVLPHFYASVLAMRAISAWSKWPTSPISLRTT